MYHLRSLSKPVSCWAQTPQKDRRGSWGQPFSGPTPFIQAWSGDCSAPLHWPPAPAFPAQSASPNKTTLDSSADLRGPSDSDPSPAATLAEVHWSGPRRSVHWKDPKQ